MNRVGSGGDVAAEEAAGDGRAGEPPSRAQSRAPVPVAPWTRAAKAVALLTAMTSKEVPTATGMGLRSTGTSAGTSRSPPPTPKKPVTDPTRVAVASTLAAWAGDHRARLALFDGDAVSSLSQRGVPARRSIDTATMSSSAAKALSSSCGATAAEAAEPAMDPAVPRTPNSKPSRNRTCPARACGTRAISDVLPTISRELVVAAPGA